MEVSFVQKKIFDLINDSVHILLITHQKPDGDAIGSVLSLSEYLSSKGKRHKIFCKTPASNQFSFLNGFERIQSDPKLFEEKKFDLVIVCDSSDLEYAGVSDFLKNLPYKTPTIVNIDHHPTNTYFGDINLVHPKAASATEVLYEWFESQEISICQIIATCLLTGIITDTGGFSNPATNFDCLNTASRLLCRGANYKKINEHTVYNKSVNTLKFWGSILNRLQENREHQIVTTIIRKNDFKKFASDNEAADGIANFLNNMSGVKAVLVLKELEGNKIKGSFRTTREDVDVSQLAAFFGGGGHKKAAGFTIYGRLVESKKGWKIH